MAKKIIGKQAASDQAESLIAGVQKHLATGQLTFAGGQFTAVQITSELQQLVTLQAAVTTARSALAARVSTQTVAQPALRAFMSALVQCIRVQFGTQADVLADFGLAPRKAPTPPTVEQKAAASAKRAATRAARGTKGPKAKLGIKGAVTGVVVSPVVAGAPSVQAGAQAGANVAASTAAATGSKTT